MIEERLHGTRRMTRRLLACVVLVAAIAACGTSSSSSTRGPSSCEGYACSGDASFCGILAICGSAHTGYEIQCDKVNGCTCSVNVDGGQTMKKSLPFDPSYCPASDDASAVACTDGVEERFAQANAACGWGLP